MENVYPKMNIPPVMPTAVSPAMHHPYPQVNVFDIEQKHIDNYYMAPAHIKAHPLPVAAAPVHYHHLHKRPHFYTDITIILVLYILLVIVLRAPFFGGKF